MKICLHLFKINKNKKIKKVIIKELRRTSNSYLIIILLTTHFIKYEKVYALKQTIIFREKITHSVILTFPLAVKLPVVNGREQYFEGYFQNFSHVYNIFTPSCSLSS